jgi:flagellin-like hook-associated protein FlgL
MAASYSALNMKRANNNLTKSLQRLSSGKRITSPSDDAGGLAVGMKLQSALKRAAASRLNTQNGTSFLQMQDGVLKVAGEILDRMAELKSFWNDISKSDLDRETYNHEFVELQRELNMLQGQKFNGVSLFATREPDNNPLKIITSDDGLGEHIEMSRTGLFENFKSKYGADGKLNTGSHGQYRQLIGDFTDDGGILDAVPGFTSRDYNNGDVIYVNGTSDADSGYFMALKNVSAGAKIQDIGSEQSLWIRLADREGGGFAESYPNAPEYDHTNLKYNADGEAVAYLEGDIVKVPAHWASPGSYLFLEAKADVSRGISLEALFDPNTHGIGPTKFFDYVGANRSNGSAVDGKPLTEFLSANSSLPEPDQFDGTGVNAGASLAAIMRANTGLTPGAIRSNGAIYEPASDWGVDNYSSITAKNHGELVLTGSDTIEEYTYRVQGAHQADDYATSMFVYGDGAWFLSQSAATSTDIPRNSNIAITSQPHKAGDVIVAGGTFYTANANMQGDLDLSGLRQYSADDVIEINGTYVEIDAAHLGNWQGSSGTYTNGQTVVFGDNLYEVTDDTIAGTTTPGGAGNAAWSSLGNVVDSASWLGATNAVDRTADVAVATDTDYWTESVWQLGEPTTANNGRIDRTSDFTNVNNTLRWTKSHYSHLMGETVGTSYTRGDNIMYQGQNYIYVSDLDSHSQNYGGSDGYTNFGDLLRQGAVRLAPMYVDTTGGGGSSSAPGDVYFRPNEDLEFVDRLPSGEARTSGAARRTDSPIPPGDGLYNSADDAFYGGLQSGNDGLYGTMDDYYEAEGFTSDAQGSPNIDADADNNKELLDTSNTLADFSVADFVDFIQTLANVRAVNGGTMSRLSYAERILEENEINLGAAHSRIMDTDMAYESTKMARQNVLLQAAASMVTQANQLNAVVLSLLQ